MVVVAAVGRVVAGVSGSPASLAALRYAEYLATAHGAVLVPVLAWQPPGGDRAARVQPAAGLMQAWRDIACQRLGDALAAVWGGPGPEPGVDPHVERGPAGWVLVSVADHPGDVLVIGAGHGGRLRRAARCHVVRYCVAKARCPVLLVPPPELVSEIGCALTAWRLRHRTRTLSQVLADQHRPPRQ
jgi:nucleotide-binding universal stress UspA family protein